jgi:hypothetical protein
MACSTKIETRLRPVNGYKNILSINSEPYSSSGWRSTPDLNLNFIFFTVVFRGAFCLSQLLDRNPIRLESDFRRKLRVLITADGFSKNIL